jgi:hypothetical protein
MEISTLLATMALAVALIGPGRWSLDTQWLGWGRIDIRGTRNSRPSARSR